MNDYLAARRQLIDRHLAEISSHLEAPGPLAIPLRRAMTSSGKRVRGILMLAVAEAAGTQAEKVLDAAAALEMVHASSLVLDDLPAIDDPRHRRGAPTRPRQDGEHMTS